MVDTPTENGYVTDPKLQEESLVPVAHAISSHTCTRKQTLDNAIYGLATVSYKKKTHKQPIITVYLLDFR